MLADCDRCALRDIACAECVITVLPDGQAGLGDEERQALRVLAAAGLVPPLRFRPAQAATAPGDQALDFTAAPACSAGPSGPSGPVTGARPGPRRPTARRSAARPGRQPVPSHR